MLARAVNTGNVELQAAITNMLPAQVSAADPQTWQATIAAGETWEQPAAATVQLGATGPLISRLTGTTTEGDAIAIANGTFAFAPSVGR